MEHRLVISRVQAVRSLVAARQSLADLRASYEYRLGAALTHGLRRPWRLQRWASLWRLWLTIPQEPKPEYLFWALQIPQDFSDPEPAQAPDLHAARLIWQEWLDAELSWTCGAGKALAQLRKGPRQAWSLMESRWRSRDQRRRSLAPVSALPRVDDGPCCSALAPDWLAPWLRCSGVRSGQGEGERPLLLCLDASLEQKRVEEAASAACRLVCWVLDSTVPAEWEGYLRRAERVAACHPETAATLTSRLGRQVDLVLPAVAPRLHHPFGCWNEGRDLGASFPAGDGRWSSLVRAARGMPVGSEAAHELGLPAHPQPEKERFLRMRQVLQSATLEHRLHQLGLASAPGCRLATVFCASSRPGQISWVLEQFAAQLYEPKELVLLLHGPGFEPDLVRRLCEQRRLQARVLTAPARVPLGECLQRAVQVAHGANLFKFDDDDWYGPRYLDEAVMALEFSGAGVVSKVTHPVSMRSAPGLWMMRPGREFLYAVFGGGATLGGRREAFEQVAFRPRALNEDHGFFYDCLARSIPLISTSRYGFVQQRGAIAGHTWRIHDHELQKAGVELSRALRREDFDV